MSNPTRQVEQAAGTGRILEEERGKWARSFRNASKSYTLDASGNLKSTPILRQVAARLAIPDDLLNRRPVKAAKLAAFRGGGELPDPIYQPVWRRFTELVGVGAGQRALFTGMLEHEPTLLAAAARVLAGMTAAGDDLPTDWPPGIAVGGLHDLRGVQFQREFQQRLRSIPRESGKPNPRELDERTIARFAALTFVEAELPTYPPTVTLQFTNAYTEANAYFYAAHALLLYGGDATHIAVARKLLERDDQARFGFVNRQGPGRKYIEVREIALSALLRMLDRKHAGLGGVEEAQGRCPIKQAVDVAIIQDANRWPEISRRVDRWLAEEGESTD